MSDPASMKDLRERFATRMTAIARELEEAMTQASKAGTPEQRELSVRSGKRLVQALARRVRALGEVGQPEPWVTAPTRERVAAAGVSPEKTLLYGQERRPEAIRSRFPWAIDALHRRHLTDQRQYFAAARLRRAFIDAGGRAGVMDYGDGGRAADPQRRTPLQPAQEAALREFFGVWRYLEEELRALVWILVLEQPLPGETEPLSVVEVGRRLAKSNTEEHARWFCYGALKISCVRLSTIYNSYDIKRGKELEQAEARAQMERELHRRRIPNSRLPQQSA